MNDSTGDDGRGQGSDRCDGCAHDTTGVPWGDLPSALAEAARQWRDFIGAVLDYPGGLDDLIVRPAPDCWSAVEYGCHVRDALALTARRIELTVLATEPALDPWDQDEVAEAQHYRDQDPQAVADDIMVAAHELGRLLQPLSDEHRRRTATLGVTVVAVEDLARTGLHETLHHLNDARTVIPQPC